jgi:hypothetical protein
VHGLGFRTIARQRRIWFRGLRQLGILFFGVGSEAWISHPAHVILGEIFRGGGGCARFHLLQTLARRQ